VVDGRARATMPGMKAIRLEAGTCFGEMSLLDQGLRSATVTAETEMTLLVLDSRSFSSLISDVPSVARKVMRTLAERLREAEREPTH